MSDNVAIEVAKELAEAILSMVRNKHTGKIEADFKQGGVAGVKKTIVCK